MSSAEAVYLQEVKWVLPLLVLVGCWNDEPGLHLEVREGGTGATRIELYLATRPCAGCMDLLKPKGARNKLPGDTWLLDGNLVAPTPNTVYEVKSGKVIFDLLPPDAKDVDIEYVVAVGFDADGNVVGVAKLTGVTIPFDRAKFWRIALDAATDRVSSPALKPEGNRVWVWRRSDPSTSSLAACVGIEHSDGKTVERTWLVPEDDTDCDGIDLECDKFNYQAMGTTDLGNASCVTAAVKPPGVTGPTCLLGGQACIDGHADLSCGPVDPYYCVPNGLCANPACTSAAMIPQCVLMNIASHLKVAFPAETSLEFCQNGGGIAPRAQIDLNPLLRPTMLTTAVTSCTEIAFFNLGLQNIDPKPEYDIGSARFRIESLAAPCTFDLVWDKGPLPMSDLYAGLDITLANGFHLALPLRIEAVMNVCGSAAPEPILKVTNGDSLTSCARVPDP